MALSHCCQPRHPLDLREAMQRMSPMGLINLHVLHRLEMPRPSIATASRMLGSHPFSSFKSHLAR